MERSSNMTRNEKRFGIIGTIGNGNELIPAPRNTSYHVARLRKGEAREEVAIRNDYDSAMDLATEIADREQEQKTIVYVTRKPILTESA